MFLLQTSQGKEECRFTSGLGHDLNKCFLHASEKAKRPFQIYPEKIVRYHSPTNASLSSLLCRSKACRGLRGSFIRAIS